MSSKKWLCRGMGMLILWVWGFCVANAQQTTPLERFLSFEPLASANVSLLVMDLDRDSVLVDYHSREVRNPASVTKLVTTASALEMLTDTFRFKTVVEHDGTIRGDVLEGNVYIRGGGDPTLESAHIARTDFYGKCLKAFQDAGIREITGQIIGDASLFQEDGSPFHWLMEDIGSSYSPTPSALSAHDNLLNVTLSSDSSGVHVTDVKPFTSMYIPQVQMTASPKSLAWRVTKTDYSWTPVIRGNIPLGSKRTIRTEMPEPAMFVADSLHSHLVNNGILIHDGITTSRWQNEVAASRTPIYVHRSLPLGRIVQVTNHLSNNLYAENIFRLLSLQVDSLSPCDNPLSARAISSFWKKRGLPSDRIFQVDGSGLSMKNAISAEFLVSLLRYMKKESRYADVFLASLPVAGRSGTVAKFMAGTKLDGKAHLKSGSMERVQNYAGYIHYNQRWYAFSVMVANFSGARRPVVNQISTLLNEIVAEDAARKR